MRCAVVRADGTVMDRVERATPHDQSAITPLIELMREVADGAECGQGVVGVPGRVNYQLGLLEYAPNLPQGWVPALTEAGLTNGVGGLPVSLANDADLAAIGETWFGAGKAHADVVYVTFSTGVGAGVVLARRLLHGRRSLVEIGHTVIDLAASGETGKSTLEELASGTALGRIGLEAGLSGGGAEVVAAAKAGEPGARAVWDRVAAAAAAGVVNLAWLFTPEVIVVGGGLGLVGDLLLDPMRAALTAVGPPALDPPIKVVEAALGDDAGLAGAAAWAEAFVPESAARGRAPLDRRG